MTTFIITTEDEKAGILRNLLKKNPLVKTIREASYKEEADVSNEFSLDRIKQLLAEAKEKGLFNNIKDASDWQREIRKEWDRGF